MIEYKRSPGVLCFENCVCKRWCYSVGAADTLGYDLSHKKLAAFFVSMLLSICLSLSPCMSLSLSPHLSQFSFATPSSMCLLVVITFMNNLTWRGFLYLISMAYLAQFSDNSQCKMLDNLFNNISYNYKLQTRQEVSHSTFEASACVLPSWYTNIFQLIYFILCI